MAPRREERKSELVRPLEFSRQQCLQKTCKKRGKRGTGGNSILCEFASTLGLEQAACTEIAYWGPILVGIRLTGLVVSSITSPCSLPKLGWAKLPAGSVTPTV